jgi:hypothetical protein
MHRIHNENLSTEEKRQLWSELITECEGLSIPRRKFCMERGIKYDHFAYYYSQQKKKLKKTVSPMKFIPAQPHKINAQKLSLACHGFEIHVPEEFEEAHLLRVLQVLRQLSC